MLSIERAQKPYQKQTDFAAYSITSNTENFKKFGAFNGILVKFRRFEQSVIFRRDE